MWNTLVSDRRLGGFRSLVGYRGTVGVRGAAGRSGVGASSISWGAGASLEMSGVSSVSSVGVRTMSSALMMSAGAADGMSAGVGSVLGGSGLSYALGASCASAYPISSSISGSGDTMCGTVEVVGVTVCRGAIASSLEGGAGGEGVLGMSSAHMRRRPWM